MLIIPWVHQLKKNLKERESRVDLKLKGELHFFFFLQNLINCEVHSYTHKYTVTLSYNLVLRY